MIIPDSEALAQDFRAGTGLHDTFARQIMQAAPLKLPLVPVQFSRLNVPTIEYWLGQRGIATPLRTTLATSAAALWPFVAMGSSLYVTLIALRSDA
jgi:hypothetical protein